MATQEDLSKVGRNELEARVLGRKNDAGKLRYDLMPVEAMELIVGVLGHGAVTYGEDNWRHLERARDRYYAAAFRHLTQWRKGERVDGDSGLPHLAHAACSLIFLLVLDQGNEGTQR